MTHKSFAAAILGFLSLGLTPAAAQYYSGAPWCAVVTLGAGDVHWECIYRSVEECRPKCVGG